jgi:hypothetical protein
MALLRCSGVRVAGGDAAARPWHAASPPAGDCGPRGRARGSRRALKAWMGRENAVIMAVLCLLIGAKLLGDGIAAL